MAIYNPTTGGMGYAPMASGLGNPVGQIAMPNPAADLGAQIPGLSGLNTRASNVIQNQLMGQLSPDTLSAIKNSTAAWGAANGQPGGANNLPGTIGGNLTAQDIGQTSQQLQNQGIQNYNSYVPTVSSTQTVTPAIQTEVNEQNAVNAASPNPNAAATYAQQLFQSYLSQLQKGPPTPASKAGLPDNGEFATNWMGTKNVATGQFVPQPTI